MPLPRVFINGWAMPTCALATLLESLTSETCRVIPLSDLVTPGDITLDTLLLALHQKMPDTPCQLIGWSYGGMLACAYAAHFPQQVKALVTLAMNPGFIAQADWQAGMAAEVFEQFVQRFSTNPEKTRRQFIALCCMGGSNGTHQRRQLFTKMPVAAAESLLSLLQLFGTLDIRPLMTRIQCLATHLYGEQDAVVPVAVSTLMQAHYPLHRTERIKGSHCFFMDNPAPVSSLIRSSHKEVASPC